MNTRSTFAFLIFVSIALMAGCSSSPKLKDYSERILDRPYTLLEGMTEGQVNMTRGYPKTNFVYDLSQPFPLNVYWTHALSDDFSFIWFILPIGLKYQWIRTPNHTLGFQFLNHLGDPDDPNMSPYLIATDRIRLGLSMDLQTDLGGESLLLFKQGGVNWALSLMSGPRLQLHSDHLVHLWLGLLDEIVSGMGYCSVSSGLNYIWSVKRTLELELRVTQRILGQRSPSLTPSGDVARPASPGSVSPPDTTGSVSLRYFW